MKQFIIYKHIFLDIFTGPLSNGGSNDRAPELIAGLDSLKTNKNNKPKKNLIAQTTRKIDSNNQDDVPLGALLSTKPKQVDNHMK